MRERLLENIISATPASTVYSGKTLLLTGASGQIGLNVAGLALARGARVIAVCHQTRITYSHPHLTWLNADLTVPKSFFVPPADALIHTAPIWLLPDVMLGIVGAGIDRIVAFSSTSVISKRDSANAAELAMVDILAEAEERLSRIAAERDLHLTLLRPTMIYGMGIDANITRMARMIRKFGFVPIYKPASGLRQPVQARDLAEAALAVWGNPTTYGKAYNLGGGQALSYRAMVERLFRHLGKKPFLVPLPFLPYLLDVLNSHYPFMHVNGEIARRMNRDLVFDIGPAAEDFGYRPRGFLEGDVIV
jgi:nucleoside-diphosphate-sugar epimerase